MKSWPCVAQNKPASGTYRRLENTDDQEMQPMAEAAPQAHVQTQPTPQPPPYIGYVPAAVCQQASNSVSTQFCKKKLSYYQLGYSKIHPC